MRFIRLLHWNAYLNLGVYNLGGNIRWCGFDFGLTIVNTLTLYNNTIEIIKEVYDILGKTTIIDKKLKRLNKMLLKCPYDERLMDGIVDRNKIEFLERHFRLKQLLHKNIQFFYKQIFDNNPRAITLFNEKRALVYRNFKPAAGLKECLIKLKDKDVDINIVSDVESESERDLIPKFLVDNDLAHYFSEVITNYGKIKKNGDIDLSYRGLKKSDGSIYKKILKDLQSNGIKSSQALIVGDRPIEDVEIPAQYGFKTVQYIGIIKRECSKFANFIVSDIRMIAPIIDTITDNT
jgi:FMN phosphatase YigB (HAD superfamily)